jgi:hypothetical protein
MKIIVFGLEREDQLLPMLRRRFPSIGFQKYDRSIDLEEEGPELVVIDTVAGLEGATLIEDLDSISPSRALSGSEMVMTLRIMVKIGSIKRVRVLAVPPGLPEREAFDGLSALIERLPG